MVSGYFGLVGLGLEVGLVGSPASQSVMGPLGVVELDVFGQPLSELASGGSGIQVDVLVLDGAPQPLHEDVVDGASAAVHGDGDAVRLQYRGERGAGELGTLDALMFVKGQREEYSGATSKREYCGYSFKT